MKSVELSKNQGRIFYETVEPRLNNYFQTDYCLIDVGAGNGCCGLFWPNHVHFVDRRKPNSFAKLSKEFAKQNYEYHECNFQDFQTKEIPGKKALIAIHACRDLSDLIIERAIVERIPVAIVPCCHPQLKNYKTNVSLEEIPFFNDPSRYIDDIRKDRLQKQGFACGTKKLEGFASGKNRLLIALPATESSPVF